MTLIETNEKKTLKPSAPTFWQRAARFLGIMLGVTTGAYLIGFGVAAGLGEMLQALPKALLGTVVVSLIAGWVPVGFYYEGHRYRWLYITLYYLLSLLAAFFIGYAVGSAA